MRKVIFPISIALVCSAALSGCVTDQRAARYQLEQQNVGALNWMQQSGEYEALAYQAFNSARKAFDTAKVRKGYRKAVIVDLDETMIDNSAYAGWRIQHNVPYTEKTWARWMAAEQARSIPGAVDFARHVNSHGGTMFYVTNRDAKSFEHTAANIRKLGFPGVSTKTLLLNSGQSNKQARFDTIKAAGFDAVVYVGDNLNDFGGVTYHKNNQQRRAFVAANQAAFGTKFFMLPNPSYGDWVSGMAPEYYKQSVEKQLQISREAIRAWAG
ncbi:5'-nucleotidase, lipoprotein e(P4) family [Ochrobactrum quorumnocens]|jgi:5'-nucleotidase (lipoprotein e(P4) family)|uniref:5'-nucleotidase, lipoprotein e(P4) family n=1 Tax=Ochrobactrum quorumnocens TaxID=271865 RepID=A0A5N1JP00_9HYPH|nr:5'-nucleotidase, lipoprotein e(P4) family [[Ochrobactrum] quorumnocens]KAA9361226.1 5'-nucleotidase, lipoprotein e(P4) family [[Ochrobactrum] quorumnocens]MBD7992796.1 5'-nucleotidase, lipoprotein e(P4) family [Ochrobactrum gallinarum]